MRLSRAALEKRFDRLYAEAGRLLGVHQPCAIRDGSCYSMRTDPERHRRMRMAFCCGGCTHLGPQGCTVESLHCKLFICEPLEKLHIRRKDGRRVYSPLVKALRRLTAQADKYAFRVFRGTREESIQKGLRKQERLAALRRRGRA
jgi:hypothetical protein